MMKMKLWQKAGLVAAIVGGLTLGGLTLKNSGLEGKVMPSISMSAAEAKTTNPDGYKVPDLTGYWKNDEILSDEDKNQDGIKETVIEQWINSKEDKIYIYKCGNKIWAYGVVSNPHNPLKDHLIRDSDCDGVFEEKYGPTEAFYIPDCAKK